MRRLVERSVRAVAVGVIEGIIYYVSLVEITPRLLSSLQSSMGASALSLPGHQSLVLVGFFFIGLAVASRILEGHIAGAMISSLAGLLSFIFIAYLMNGGIIRVENVEYAGGTMNASLDLRPLLGVMFLFYTIPGMLLPLIDHYYRLAERNEEN